MIIVDSKVTWDDVHQNEMRTERTSKRETNRRFITATRITEVSLSEYNEDKNIFNILSLLYDVLCCNPPIYSKMMVIPNMDTSS